MICTYTTIIFLGGVGQFCTITFAIMSQCVQNVLLGSLRSRVWKWFHLPNLLRDNHVFCLLKQLYFDLMRHHFPFPVINASFFSLLSTLTAFLHNTIYIKIDICIYLSIYLCLSVCLINNGQFIFLSHFNPKKLVGTIYFKRLGQCESTTRRAVLVNCTLYWNMCYVLYKLTGPSLADQAVSFCAF